MTLREFLEKQETDKNLTKLFAETLTLGIVRIRGEIEEGNRGHAGSSNVFGEKQLALDVEANMILKEVLKNSSLVRYLASEEEEKLEEVGNEKCPFTVVFDPLDGSSLVNVNFVVGSIFGVFKGENPVGKKGKDMLASAFAVYGPRTSLIISVGKGTHEFLLGMDGQFHLSKENLKISEDAKYFAPGNLRAGSEREDYRKLFEYWIMHGYTLRYSGGMVPDLNHIFLKGNGIFTYPPYSEMPEGKLRLLYECAPMAFLAEQAGGSATDGKISILDKEIRDLHQRTPIYIGSKDEVTRAEEYLS